MTTDVAPARSTDWSRWTEGLDGRTGGRDLVPVVEPATGETLVELPTSTPADVDARARAAVQAQREWARATHDVRAEVFRRAAHLLDTDHDRLLRWLVPESGSAQGKAHFEVGLVVAELYEAAALASAPYGELLRSVRPRLSMARRVPLGVVGVISPFNFPAILSMRSVAPALALGNAVLLKPDPRTPVSGGLALADLLAEAGLPDGLLHTLVGGAEVGQALVEHPGVPCLSFTGSTAAGRHIAAAAAGQLKRVHLELGGNNALLVLPDADVAAAASAAAWGSFLHQGQICMTTGRHIVHSSLVQEFTALLSAKADAVPVGNPTDPAHALGPLIDAHQRDRVQELVDGSVARGATLLAGGTSDGLFYRPTVLGGVDSDSPAWRKEIFGPVAPVTGYDTLDEAVDLVNDSEYGLSVGILTSDAFAGFELTDRIHAGLVHVNDQTVDDEATIPFGGVKASGSGGTFGGARANLESFTESQWVTVQSRIQRYPF